MSLSNYPFGPPDWDGYVDFVACYSERSVKYPCACHPGSAVRLCTIIGHLNDKHKWSFTQIADWLDSLHLKSLPRAS